MGYFVYFQAVYYTSLLEYIKAFLKSIYAIATSSSSLWSTWGCTDLYIVGLLFFLFHCVIVYILPKIVHEIKELYIPWELWMVRMTYIRSKQVIGLYSLFSFEETLWITVVFSFVIHSGILSYSWNLQSCRAILSWILLIFFKTRNLKCYRSRDLSVDLSVALGESRCKSASCCTLSHCIPLSCCLSCRLFSCVFPVAIFYSELFCFFFSNIIHLHVYEFFFCYFRIACFICIVWSCPRIFLSLPSFAKIFLFIYSTSVIRLVYYLLILFSSEYILACSSFLSNFFSSQFFIRPCILISKPSFNTDFIPQ